MARQRRSMPDYARELMQIYQLMGHSITIVDNANSVVCIDGAFVPMQAAVSHITEKITKGR